MNKTWITGLTIAGIAGSGGIAFAGVSAIQSAAADSAPAAAPAAARSVTYQIGVAGLVTIKSDGTALTADDPHPGVGWTFVGATSGAASHVEVQFTDGQQLVTFTADLVGSDIVVSVTNVEAPGATTTTAVPEPIVVTIVTEAPEREAHVVATTPPVTPAPTPPVVTTEHAVTNPASATTTKPSPKHHEEDDHESEQNDD